MMLNQLFIYLGSDYSYEKFIPLTIQSQKNKIMHFSDGKALKLALNKTIPDALLIHEVDFNIIRPLLENEYNAGNKFLIILISNGEVHNVNGFNILNLTENFTENDLARTLAVDKQQNLSCFQSAEILNLIIHHLPIALFWKDLNLKYIGCNQFFCNDRGLKNLCDINGLTDEDLFPEEVAKKIMNLTKKY